MTTIRRTAMDAMDRRERARLVNSLSGVRPAVLIGTTNGQGTHNLAVFNSLMHIGSAPPLLGLIVRPDAEVRRHTLENLTATGHFTINHMPGHLRNAAHDTSAKLSAAVSEFEACGLTPLIHDDLRAPAVAESPVRIGCRLVERQAIRSNGTILVIGEVVRLDIDDAHWRDGAVRHDGLNAVCGTEDYYDLRFVERRGFVRPDDVSPPAPSTRGSGPRSGS